MNLEKIGIYSHPTTCLLVDDNKQFLEIVAAELFSEKMASLFYDNPQMVLKYLAHIRENESSTDGSLIQNDEFAPDHLTINLNIKSIHSLIYKKDRFKEISNIVVDFAMPSMNGIELCRKINNDYIYKILLTGEASKDLAVEAFNEGLINKFIMKSSSDATELLCQSIKELQAKFFIKRSEMFLNAMDNQAKGIVGLLKDENFLVLFNRLYTDNQFFEYYLLDEQGSFLFLDFHGKPSWLLMKSEREMEKLYQYARDEEAPSEVISMLKERKKIPYFHSEEDLQTPPSGWLKYMHPAIELKGSEQNYYYSFFKETSLYALEMEKVFSYYQYLEAL